MIEITFENIKARTEALNLQLFNFKSKMRFALEVVNNHLRYSLKQYDITKLPLEHFEVSYGNISTIFSYQQVVFNTLSMLRAK